MREDILNFILSRVGDSPARPVLLTDYADERTYSMFKTGDEYTLYEHREVTAWVVAELANRGIAAETRIVSEVAYRTWLETKGRTDSPGNRAAFINQDPPKRGAQPGNKNASRGEENDGQFLLHLPRKLREEGKATAKKSGDGGLSEMLRRLLREEINRFKD